MLAKIKSYGLRGVEGFEIVIETDVQNGLPVIEMVGMPDTAVKESKERVKSAIKNSGFAFAPKKITVNFAPADIKKEGAMYDLPVALGILSATGQLGECDLSDIIVIGELSLYGEIREVRGILPIIIAAKDNGFKNVIVPKANAAEASFVDGINIYAPDSLMEAVHFLRGGRTAPPIKPRDINTFIGAAKYEGDFKYVKGQYAAKRAMEIAAAGSHNILFIGAPGGGKTMLAKCLPSILPDMTVSEALETTKIHSIAGILDNRAGVVNVRPFRCPHHTASRFALSGGGANSRPGEISLAHNGVLFLDELTEYPRAVLEILRQPLEDNKIVISRAAKSIEYPASFMLVASMNPCPCGNYGSADKHCTCTPAQITRYLSKLSGPLMDRIDLHIEVGAIGYDELSNKAEGEGSKEIRQRVNEARKIQQRRFFGTGIYSNSKMNNEMLGSFCALDEKSEGMLKAAFSRLKLSARAYTRILKVARTIADLNGSEKINSAHIGEAIGYRSLDRDYFG